MHAPVIAAQTFTVRAFTDTEDGIARALSKIKSLGYDCIQVSAFGPYRVEFLRDKLLECGLTVCATHVPYQRLLEETERVIEEHKTIGAKYVGLGFRRITTLSDAQKIVEDLLPVAERIADSGLQFVYHNHQTEFLKLENGQTAMQYFLENTPPTFGLLPDVYWLQYAGMSPVRFIGENADRIKVVHFKDMTVGADATPKMAEIFEGNMDFRAIFDACVDCGVEYIAVEQDDCYGKDPFACLETSRKNIKTYLGI